MDTLALYRRYQFFKANAGYATPPGLAACALALARAEVAAEDTGLTFEYAPDDYDASWTIGADGRYHAVPSLVVRAVRDGDASKTTLAVIGGVDVDGDRGFYRVIEAQLAFEALTHAMAAHG